MQTTCDGPSSQSMQHFQGSASMSTVWASHFTFHFWQQTQWICEDDGVCGLTVVSWAVQQWPWVTASTFIVKLEVDNALSSWMVVAPCLTVKPILVFGNWAISVHYEILHFADFFNKKLDPWLLFPFWTFLAVPSQIFWQECLIEMLELIWAPFPLLGLLKLCQLEFLQNWILCLTHPRLAPFQSASFCVFHSFMEWLWGFSMALKHALVCICGMSCMNLMVSMGMSLVVHSMTLFASFCTLSSFSRFVCAIAVMPSP